MDAIFKINKVGVSSISILGLELDNDEYLKEDGVLISTRSYAFSHSVTLNTIKYTSSDKFRLEHQINLHTTGCIDESTFILEEDGLIETTHCIVPTDVWLNYVATNDSNALTRYNSIVYYNTKTNQFKRHYISSNVPEDILSPEEVLKEENIPSNVTTVVKAEKNTFNMYYLKVLYNKIASQYLDNILHRPNISHETKRLKMDLDFILMGIKSISFLIEDLQLHEAQLLLEDLGSIVERNKYANPLIKHGSY